MQPVSAVSSPEAVVVALIDSSSTLLVTKDYTLAPEVQRKKETDAGRLTGLIIHRRRINGLCIIITPAFIITAIVVNFYPAPRDMASAVACYGCGLLAGLFQAEHHRAKLFPP